MEGITGVVQPAQLGPGGFEYQSAREWMTGEVNAAIGAIRDAGPAEIVVCDSHGNGQNVLIDKLPDDVRLVRGFPRPLEMMQGLDDSFAAAVFIGYHASEWTADAVRGHTISSARLLGIKLNGMEVSEGIYNAALAGQFGVPIAFVSGDRLAVTQLQKVIPAAEGVIVKEPYGYHSAMRVTPARGQAMIREGVKRAMAKLGSLQPYRVTAPVALEVGFKLTIDLEGQTVATTNGGTVFSFSVDPFRKHCLLNGLDDIALTLTHADEIRAFEAKRKAEQPWLF
jgi:D-amino peptidase